MCQRLTKGSDKCADAFSSTWVGFTIKGIDVLVEPNFRLSETTFELAQEKGAINEACFVKLVARYW